MSSFSIGNVSYNSSIGITGQQFVPNSAGPAGSGNPGTASTASLTSIIVGFPNGNWPRSSSVSVLSAPAADVTAVDQDPNLVAQSTSYQDGNAFGTGSNTRTYSFGTPPALAVGSAFYLYFPEMLMIRCETPTDYSGGSVMNEDGDLFDACAQFKIQFTT